MASRCSQIPFCISQIPQNFTGCSSLNLRQFKTGLNLLKTKNLKKGSTKATLIKKVYKRELGYSLIKIQIGGLLENGMKDVYMEYLRKSSLTVTVSGGSTSMTRRKAK